MALLVLFALIAGAATALSPCVLPVLPVVLAAGATGGRRRPLGIVTGLAISFTFATVALVYVIAAFGLPNGFLRTLAIVVLLLFGVSLAVPAFGARLEAWLTRLAPRARPGDPDAGFGSGMLGGLSLGLVYAPCAGPILAGVITLSAAQSFTAGRLAVAFAYGVGSAVVLYALMLGGRRVTRRLSRRAGTLQSAMGVVMVLVAVLMLGGYDTRFQTAIASDLPSFLVDPSAGLERHVAPELPPLGDAPDFVGNERWFNTPGGRPLSIRGLRGHVVLVDFWTYTCINCIRTLPYLKAWDRRYRRAGLTIVGVHTPEFAFEHDAGNVARAIGRFGIRYPVAQDNENATWNAWGNQYWPADYLVDARGRVRYVTFGEGEYGKTETAIRRLLAEAGHRDPHARARPTGAVTPSSETTPETYLGVLRAQGWLGGGPVPGRHTYPRVDGPLPLNGFEYGGRWDIGPEPATPVAGATIDREVQAERGYLVLSSAGGRPRGVQVLLDGHPAGRREAGADAPGGRVTVTGQRLYELVSLPRSERRRLTLRFAPGVSGFAFTFG